MAHGAEGAISVLSRPSRPVARNRATWLLSIAAGISLLAGHGGGLYLLAFAVLLGIALEVAAAWSLVVWVGKDTRGKDIMPGRQRTPERLQAGQLDAEQDGSRAAAGQLSDGRRMSGTANY